MYVHPQPLFRLDTAAASLEQGAGTYVLIQIVSCTYSATDKNQRRRRYLLDVVPHGSFAGVRRSFPAQNDISPVCF